jgi:two-component system sensor histidine kinase KdpD
MVIQRRRDTRADGPLEQDNLWGNERLARGVFWLLIAATLLLSLCETPAWSDIPRPCSAGWGGVFVLYYALRSARGHARWQRKSRQRFFPVWRAVPGFLSPSVGDLLVISVLVSLSGGWASPLYLLYVGWAITVLAEPSWGHWLLVSVLAPVFLAGAVILAGRSPLSPDQTVIISEHILLVVLVSLGVSALRLALEWNERRWAAERQQWKLLRHTVFSQLSHELFTPLSAIETSAALLVDETGEGCLADEQRRQLLEVIRRNCTRMSLLLDELLEMWRSGQRQFPWARERLECLSLAQEIVHTLQPLFGAKQQECAVVAEPPSVAVLARRQQLEQVLVNLLGNAQKYSPMHSRVLLEIRGEADMVRFAVRDEGPGISYEEQQSLFELAFQGAQAVSSGRSVGLGLALAKALVVAQSGRIWVESRPGQGSIFYFTLPRAAS